KIKNLVRAARIQIAAVQNLLPGPEPECVVLGLAVSPDLRDQNIGGQQETGHEKEYIQRAPERWPSQHEHFPLSTRQHRWLLVAFWMTCASGVRGRGSSECQIHSANALRYQKRNPLQTVVPSGRRSCSRSGAASQVVIAAATRQAHRAPGYGRLTHRASLPPTCRDRRRYLRRLYW